jgi:hypothetical protein
MVSTRLIGWRTLPLPLAGEADAPEGRGGWGCFHIGIPRVERAPTPTLPRKRERERSADVAIWTLWAIALDWRGGGR